MSGSLGDLVVSLSADMAKFQADMGRANKITQDTMSKIQTDVAKGMEGIQASFKLMGSIASGAMAVVAGGAMFKDWISTTKEVTGEVVKLTKVFGINAEEASVMRIALDDAFLTVDDAVGSSDRLTRASIKNADAFKRAGIDIRDSNGNLKDSFSVMMETNNYLKTLKEGKDRDTAAMALYGKGWRELSGILRLNGDSMKDARARAEELHLIIGPDGIEATKKYKAAMKDLGDVAESFKVRAGSELLPVLTSIAVGMERIALAGSKLPKTLDDRLLADQMHESVGVWAKIAQLQRMGMRAGMGQFLPEEERQKVYDETKANNLDPQMARIAYDKKNKSGTSGRAPDMSVDKEAALWASAHDKYLAYLKAFSVKEAEIIKAATAEQLEIMKAGYDWGMIDQQTYLSKKHAMVEKEIADEIALKKAEVAKYANEVSADKGKTDAKGAAAYHEALVKQTGAEKELIELEGKLKVTRLQNADESKKSIYDQLRGYGEINAALLDMQGKDVEAANVRKSLAESDVKRWQLIQEAMKGTAAAEAAYWAQEALDSGRVQRAIENEAKAYSGLSVQLLELTGHYEEAAKARVDMEKMTSEYKNLSPESKARKDQLLDYDVRQGKTKDDFARTDTGNAKFGTGNQFDGIVNKHEAMYRNIRQIEDRFGKESEQAHNAMWGARVDMARDATSMISGALMKGNKEQFEAGKALAIAMAAVDGAMAVTKALASSPPPMNFISAGLVAAATGMQVGIIAGTQYQAREKGGPVSGGQTYLVGEKGPELFTPGSTGMITPNNQLGGRVINIHQNFQITGVGADIAQNTRTIAKQAADNAKAEILNDMNRGGTFAVASGRMK